MAGLIHPQFHCAGHVTDCCDINRCGLLQTSFISEPLARLWSPTIFSRNPTVPAIYVLNNVSKTVKERETQADLVVVGRYGNIVRKGRGNGVATGTLSRLQTTMGDHWPRHCNLQFIHLSVQWHSNAVPCQQTLTGLWLYCLSPCEVRAQNRLDP